MNGLLGAIYRNRSIKMPGHTPKERAKRGSSHNSNRGSKKGIKVTVSVQPIKRKPKKRK